MMRSDVYASERYDASQKLGEEVGSSGGAGLIYNSLRRQTRRAGVQPDRKDKHWGKRKIKRHE